MCVLTLIELIYIVEKHNTSVLQINGGNYFCVFVIFYLKSIMLLGVAGQRERRRWERGRRTRTGKTRIRW